MAIIMHFYNLIIPIENLQKCKEFNNLEKIFSRYNPKAMGVIVLHDEYLFKDGAMNYLDIEDEIKFWEEQGLKPTKIIDGKKYWDELCVVDAINGPTLPCEWLEFVCDKKVGTYVYLKGKPIGKIVGRNKF